MYLDSRQYEIIINDGLGEPIANWAKDAEDKLKDGGVSRRSAEKGMADGASSSGP